jgi:hypothetical protein
LIDLPYITHPQAAKQDAKLWMLNNKMVVIAHALERYSTTGELFHDLLSGSKHRLCPLACAKLDQFSILIG